MFVNVQISGLSIKTVAPEERVDVTAVLLQQHRNQKYASLEERLKDRHHQYAYVSVREGKLN